MLPQTPFSLPYLKEMCTARPMVDIYDIVIYCSVVQYSALGHSSSGGGGRVILSLCRVGGLKGNAPTQKPVASSRNWI